MRAEALNEAFQNLDHSASRSRLIGGSVSSLTGLTGTVAGFFLVLAPKKPVDEALVGLSLFTLGSINLYDGFSRVVGTSSAEFIIPHYKNFGEGKPTAYGGGMDKQEYGHRSLIQLSDYGYKVRMLRGALDLLSSACYWYLFAKGNRVPVEPGSLDESGKDIYQYAIIPAITLSAFAVYRFLFRSPEERAWERVKDQTGQGQSWSERIGFFAGLTPHQSTVGIRIAF